MPARAFGASDAVVRDEADDPALRQALDDRIARLSDELFVREGWPNPFAARRSRPVPRRAERRRRRAAPLFAFDRAGADRRPDDRDRRIGSRQRRHRPRGLAPLRARGDLGLRRRGSHLRDRRGRRVPRRRRRSGRDGVRRGGAEPGPGGSPRALSGASCSTSSRARPEAALPSVKSTSARAISARSRSRAWRTSTPSAPDCPRRRLSRVSARVSTRLRRGRSPGLPPSGSGTSKRERSTPACPPPGRSATGPTCRRTTRRAIRYDWPAGAGVGAAIVHYRDADLPPDVVSSSPTAADDRALRASRAWTGSWPRAGLRPVPWFPSSSRRSGYPFAGLQPHAIPPREGPRLWWTTASNAGLTGWAVFREEVQADGRIVRTGPQIVPASSDTPESLRYAYLDPASARELTTVTRCGPSRPTGFARAFSATLRTPE